jgi:hypothetical protein
VQPIALLFAICAILLWCSVTKCVASEYIQAVESRMIELISTVISVHPFKPSNTHTLSHAHEIL